MTDGDTNPESTSLLGLVSSIEQRTCELKLKLNDIIKLGKDYEEDIRITLVKLLSNNDNEIVSLSLQAIAEIVKCDKKRLLFATNEVLEACLNVINSDLNIEHLEKIKQSCRCLGNLCCDCDNGRNAILNCNGAAILSNYFKNLSDNKFNNEEIKELKAYSCQFLLNFCLGGSAFTKPLIEKKIIDSLYKMMLEEYNSGENGGKVIATGLLLLSIFNENSPDLIFDDNFNKLVVNILKKATDIDVAESCFDVLSLQAEHDSVKALLAAECVVELLCLRLELALQRRASGDISPDDEEVKAVTKQACDLIILILTGDEAMETVYSNGVGPSYLQIIRWLDTTDYEILSTAALAVGDFARTDTHCLQMMNEGVFDKLLDLFERHHHISYRIQSEPHATHPVDEITSSKIEFALLSALRNLSVPVENKKVVAALGRAIPILLKALPRIKHAHVAYKLLATLRMLADGQEGVSRAVLCSSDALRSIVQWGGGDTSFAAEAPRLLARVISNCSTERLRVLEVDGCLSCLITMLLATHTIMQNEAILALTLISIEALNSKGEAYRDTFVDQLLKSEIGKHIAVMIETNSAKMPQEVAVNLLAFLDITGKCESLTIEYRVAKVDEGLKKVAANRNEFSEDFRTALIGVCNLIESK